MGATPDMSATTATLDGNEIYFHAHSVLHDGFRHLKIGDEVRFVEETGEKGPQASTVHIVAHTATQLPATAASPGTESLSP